MVFQINWKRRDCSIYGVGKNGYPIGKQLYHYLTSHRKINSRLMKDLNVKLKLFKINRIYVVFLSRGKLYIYKFN